MDSKPTPPDGSVYKQVYNEEEARSNVFSMLQISDLHTRPKRTQGVASPDSIPVLQVTRPSLTQTDSETGVSR